MSWADGKQCWFGNCAHQSILVHFVHVAYKTVFNDITLPWLREASSYWAYINSAHKRRIYDQRNRSSDISRCGWTSKHSVSGRSVTSTPRLVSSLRVRVRVRSATITYRLYFNKEDYQMAKLLNDSKLIESQDLVITVTQFLVWWQHPVPVVRSEGE